MKLFELIPQKLSDLLPPKLNQDIPPPIDQLAEQLIETGKIAGYAGVGLAIKTRDYAINTLNELIEIGEQALGEPSSQIASEEATETASETPTEPAQPSLEELFTKASEDIKTLNGRPDNSTLGELYALYKQATIGDVSGKRPGLTKVAERYKFDAWTKKQGMDRDIAKQAYIDKVESLLAS
ncbi:acyl-CoA-binding protein [Litoribrevibacter euphylliae]|uniref:Acyl-CoA-binding protein n=1 Tax=Litoribrevibacter euphylliae TaxID=1834034 RepID=A0ABV7HEB7_9GAMM